jgi:hypothetical protein
MKNYALLLAALIWPIQVFSDTWVPITSEIPGMQLWTFPQDVYAGNDNEFMHHCNSGKQIYVSILDSPVKCSFTSHPTADGFFQMTVKATDNRVPDQRLVIVSKNPIPQRIKPLAISQREIEILRKMERKAVAEIDHQMKLKFLNNFKDATTKDHANYVIQIKASEKYRKFIGARTKLPSSNGVVYISSVGLDSSETIGWEIVNVVYRDVGGNMQQIGTFAGCVKGGFRDLNSDGTPEVLSSTCENGESVSDSYWSLLPKIEKVLGH